MKSIEHGTGGAVHLSYQEEWLPTTRDVFKAAEEVGLGANSDVNNGNPIGMGIGPVCIYNGIRVTSSSAYLSDARSNLTIVTDAQIAKIILDGKVAVGVQTVDGRRFAARKEVIISAGALNSPQLLLLSGIGPEEELQKHSITPIHRLRQVGKNLQDHCFSTAGIIIKKEHDKSFKQSPTPMGWFQIPAVLASEEFKDLSTEMQNYLRRHNVPSWELATVSPSKRLICATITDAVPAHCFLRWYISAGRRGDILLHLSGYEPSIQRRRHFEVRQSDGCTSDQPEILVASI